MLLGASGVVIAGIVLLVLLLLGLLVVLYWFFRLLGLMVMTPFRAARRVRGRRTPTGAGANYEQLVLSEGRRRRRTTSSGGRRSGKRAFYEPLSWAVSIALSVVVVALAGVVAHGVMGNTATGGVEFVVLVLVIVAWVWVWRRYHAPLLHFIPRDEYERFAEWRDKGGS